MRRFSQHSSVGLPWVVFSGRFAGGVETLLFYVERQGKTPGVGGYRLNILCRFEISIVGGCVSAWVGHALRGFRGPLAGGHERTPLQRRYADIGYQLISCIYVPVWLVFGIFCFFFFLLCYHTPIKLPSVLLISYHLTLNSKIPKN